MCRPTQVVTRPGASATLFVQRRGLSACTFARGGTRLPFFCDGVARCRAFLVPSRSAHAMVQVAASGAVTIDLCAGQAAARVQTPDGYAEGYADASDDVGARVRITFRKEADGQVAVSADDRFTRGRCKARVFRDQRAAR